MKALLFLIVSLFFTSPLPPAGNGWMPSFTTEIGVKFYNPPEAGEEFSTVTGKVADPMPLTVWGFSGLKKGDNVSITREASLKLKGKDKTLVRISTDEWYEVLVVESGEKLVPVFKYW